MWIFHVITTTKHTQNIRPTSNSPSKRLRPPTTEQALFHLHNTAPIENSSASLYLRFSIDAIDTSYGPPLAAEWGLLFKRLEGSRFRFSNQSCFHRKLLRLFIRHWTLFECRASSLEQVGRGQIDLRYGDKDQKVSNKG